MRPLDWMKQGPTQRLRKCDSNQSEEQSLKIHAQLGSGLIKFHNELWYKLEWVHNIITER